jgi:hypothetical protein
MGAMFFIDNTKFSILKNDYKDIFYHLLNKTVYFLFKNKHLISKKPLFIVTLSFNLKKKLLTKNHLFLSKIYEK